MKRREDPPSNSGGRTTKFRRRCLKDSAKQVFESIPQIPINVKEIKKIILKDQFISTDQSIDEKELLNVLTANCKGRNALFFQAYGHTKVFGLRSSIPDGSTQILDAGKEEKGNKESLSGKIDDSVLYVQLPDGYPVITDDGQGRDRARRATTTPAVDPLSLDSEIIILDSDDGGDVEIVPDDSIIEIVPDDPIPVQTPVKPKATSSGRPKRETAGKRRKASPVAEEKPSSRTTKAKPSPVAAEKQKQPQKPTPTVTPPPASAVPSTARIVPSLVRRSSNTNEIEIPYVPTSSDLPFVKPRNTKEILTSIPGFNMKKVKLNKSNSSNRKLSCAQMIQQTKEGQLNLESPESILGQVNLRGLLNKGTFSRLPGVYQFKLQQLLPETERLHDEKRGLRLNPSAFNNEFFAKACHEWRERLLKGDFTPEALQKSKNEMDSDRRKLDSWKRKNFEPVWGAKKSYKIFSSFEEYVERGGVSIEQEIKAAKVMHPPKKFKVDDGTTIEADNDHANASEDNKRTSEASNEDSKADNNGDNILLLVKEDNDVDDNKSQDGSVSNDAVTIIDDEENASTVDSSPSNECHDPLDTVPVEDSNAKDSLDDKITTESVQMDKDYENNDKSEVISSGVIRVKKSSEAIDEKSSKDSDEKSIEVSKNKTIEEKEDNDKLHEDNMNINSTVIDVDSENLDLLSERTLSEENKSITIAADTAETVIHENLTEEKSSLENNVADMKKPEATDSLDAEKIDNSLDTSSTMELKETIEESKDLEKEKSRENITSEESSNTSEKIHEEISENLDDEKKDITEDKSTDLDQNDENTKENKTKENDSSSPTSEENTAIDVIEETKEFKTDTEKVEHKKESRRRSDKGDSNGVEASVPTLTVSVVSEDDQEKIKDLKDLLKVQKSSPEKAKNVPTLSLPENPQLSNLSENSQEESKTQQDNFENSGNGEALESDLEGSKVEDDNNDKSDSMSIEETESLPESSHEDNTIDDEENIDVIMSEQSVLSNILSENDNMTIGESDNNELETTLTAEFSTEHEVSMNVDSEKSSDDTNDPPIYNNEDALIEDTEIIETESTMDLNNIENSEVKLDQETFDEKNEMETVDELANIDTAVKDEEDLSINEKELELTSQPELSSEVCKENVNKEQISVAEPEIALDNSLTEVATDNTDDSLVKTELIDVAIKAEPMITDSFKKEEKDDISAVDTLDQISHTNTSMSNVKNEIITAVVDNPIDAKETLISTATKLSNVALDVILPSPEVTNESKIKSISTVSHHIRPASADLALTILKDPTVGSIIYRPASAGVELDKILVKSDSGTPTIQVNFQDSTSTTNKSTNQSLLRFKSVQKTNNTTPTNTNIIPAPNKTTNKVVLKSLLPKPPPTAKNYTNYVCNTKAFLICQACGAFCHDECLNQQKICISCVIK